MAQTAMDEQTLSEHIEQLLVARNLRGMQTLQPALTPGYCRRAAQWLREASGTVLIGTGFPVLNTFETDGPVGAIALYQTLLQLGAQPVIVCGPPLSTLLTTRFHVYPLRTGIHPERQQEAEQALRVLQPQLIISIERPGLAADGHYYNMRGENISAQAACFDTLVQQARCPTVAIGDGGNEIGMGNVAHALNALANNIIPSATRCTELVIADVSNWGAYGLIALLGWWLQRDLLAQVEPVEILHYLSRHGSVDGVTRVNALTEDGLPAAEGVKVIQQLRHLTGFTD